MNNQLMYTDPSGYTWLHQFGNWISQNWKPIVTTIATAAIITAACLIPGVGEAAFLGAFFNFSLQAMSGSINSFSGLMSAIGIGTLTGMIGGGIGTLASTITTAGYVLPGVIIGTVSGGISGAIAGGLTQGLNNYLLGNGNFWGGLGQGALSGLITGGIIGGITGGIQGYKNAVKAGANPWTGEMDDARTYCSSTDGVNPRNFKQPDGTKYCYAYATAYDNPCDPIPQDYIDKMQGAYGANERDVLKALKLNFTQVEILSSTDFDNIGVKYAEGFNIIASTETDFGGHGVAITQFTLEDKINFFGGQTHQILQNVLMMDPIQGAIVPGGNYMSNGSVLSIFLPK